MKKLNKYAQRIIFNALVEYEDKYWSSEGRFWQNTINELIQIFKPGVEYE